MYKKAPTRHVSFHPSRLLKECPQNIRKSFSLRKPFVHFSFQIWAIPFHLSYCSVPSLKVTTPSLSLHWEWHLPGRLHALQLSVTIAARQPSSNVHKSLPSGPQDPCAHQLLLSSPPALLSAEVSTSSFSGCHYHGLWHSSGIFSISQEKPPKNGLKRPQGLGPPRSHTHTL